MSPVGRTVPLVALLVSTVACTAGGGGQGAASCAFTVRYQERTYLDVSDVEFTVGERLGDATLPPCDDTGGSDVTEETATTLSAYAVDGIPPEVALAVGDAPDDTRLVAVGSGRTLPPRIQDPLDRR
ncbi:DUF6281 family protein [Streptomyces sp. NPDC091377]|uniref:DUF6281 family protein n=1 Tax=unclassified Streptomyces TaxID=2593676 RepID=UPI00382D8D67